MKLWIAAAALCVASVSAHATTVIEGSANVTARDHDPGLVITTIPFNFGPFTLDLDASTGSIPSVWTVNVFGISTPEKAITLFEDTRAYAISVAFNFADPLGVTGSPITGQTTGVFRLLSKDHGRVTWDAPQTYAFGNGGAFRVTLKDTNFALGGAVTNVAGEFRLLSESISAVPEPATWAMMILGFGAVGFTMRRRGAQGKLRLASA